MRYPGRRGTNLPRMGDYNQLVVLDRIRRADEGVSRVELAVVTGLSGQTISNVVGRLLELGLVEEGARHIAGRGKPRTMLHLRAAAGYALGTHIDPVSVTTVLIDLAGTVLDRSVVTTPDGSTAVVDAVAAEVARMRALVPDDLVLGLGVAVARTRLLAVGIGVALAAFAVVLGGPIAFIALVAPQVGKRLTRASGPGLLIAALVGAALLCLADVVAQHVLPSPVPVGIAPAGVGGVSPVFLLLREWRRAST